MNLEWIKAQNLVHLHLPPFVKPLQRFQGIPPSTDEEVEALVY